MLKLTSVLQSLARAWTWVVLIGEQPNQMMPIMMMMKSRQFFEGLLLGGGGVSLVENCRSRERERQGERAVMYTFDNHRRDQSSNGRISQGFSLSFQRHQLLDGFLQNLRKRNDHDDGKDQNPQGFETFAADGKSFLQPIESPADDFVRRPDNHGAEEVQGGI